VLRLDQGIEALRLEQSDDYPVERHQEIEERIQWVLNNVGAMWT
jgi:hypothetical protein